MKHYTLNRIDELHVDLLTTIHETLHGLMNYMYLLTTIHEALHINHD